MKENLNKLIHVWHKLFTTDEKVTLKACYKGFIFFTVNNFLILILWSINPFHWSGLIGLIFDLLVSLYLLISMIIVTSTLMKRFNDANIKSINASIYPLALIGLSIILRLRIWSSFSIIAVLIIFFLSHFYLMMLIMMPTFEGIHDQDHLEN